MIVFSASGRSAVPIEMAIGARARGLKVIAVTSVEQRAGPPQHATGTRLLDHADVVLDLCTPPADAMVDIEGLDVPVGPGSTIANVAFVNSIKFAHRRAARRARRDAAGDHERARSSAPSARRAVRRRVPRVRAAPRARRLRTDDWCGFEDRRAEKVKMVPTGGRDT